MCRGLPRPAPNSEVIGLASINITFYFYTNTRFRCWSSSIKRLVPGFFIFWTNWMNSWIIGIAQSCINSCFLFSNSMDRARALTSSAVLKIVFLISWKSRIVWIYILAELSPACWFPENFANCSIPKKHLVLLKLLYFLLYLHLSLLYVYEYLLMSLLLKLGCWLYSLLML